MHSGFVSESKKIWNVYHLQKDLKIVARDEETWKFDDELKLLANISKRNFAWWGILILLFLLEGPPVPTDVENQRVKRRRLKEIMWNSSICQKQSVVYRWENIFILMRIIQPTPGGKYHGNICVVFVKAIHNFLSLADFSNIWLFIIILVIVYTQTIYISCKLFLSVRPMIIKIS